jgi:arylsulfatase A-like enzyme
VARLGHYERHARKSAERVNADFLDWLSRHKRRPYFAFLNYFDAHHPYLPPTPFDEHRPRSFEEGLGLRHWWWIDKLRLPPEHVDLAQKAYTDCLRYLDRQLGLLMDELKRRGELDNTLVVLVSDHGEHFGEHGLFLHGNSLYQPLLHVPLVIRWPGRIPAGRRIRVPVSTRHLPATIMDLAGLAADGPLSGGSLAPLLHPGMPPNTPEPSPVISELFNASPQPPDRGRSPIARGAMRSVVLGTVKYVRNGDGIEELYDLCRDPEETRNRLGDAGYQAALRRCREALAVDGQAP